MRIWWLRHIHADFLLQAVRQGFTYGFKIVPRLVIISPQGKWLAVRLLVPKKNGRYLDDVLRVVGHKNNAVPAYAFPVPPLPSPALERNDITAKRIITHLPQSFTDKCLLILGQPAKLSCGVS